MVVDAKKDPIEIGDEILLADIGVGSIHWSKRTVVGFTPCMVKVVPCRCLNDKKKGYSLVVPQRCVVIKKGKSNDC